MKNQEFGLSRYVLGALSAFLVGIFFADLFFANGRIDFGWLSGVFLGLMIGLILFYRDQYYRLVLIILLGLILGFSYYQFWDWRENRKELIYDNQLSVIGMVAEKPEINGAKQQIVVKYQNTKILVQTARYPEYHYGDFLEIKGKIENPAKIKSAEGNNFNYGQYLLKRGLRGLIQNPESVNYLRSNDNNLHVRVYKIIYKIGDKFAETLNKVLSEPYAALQSGLILGSKSSNISDSLMSAFNRTGTTHIVAVSGYNVTIIISALALLLASFSRRGAFWGSLITVIIFVILTGVTASVVRAGILAMLVAWGKSLGRRPYYPVLILWVAFAMLLFNPYALKNDISFQLSFLAFGGLVFIAPKMGQISILRFLPPKIKTIFCETMSAQAAVLPILIYNFGIISLVAPLSNILILPTIPTAMFLGFIAGIGGMIWLELGKIIGLIAWLVLKYIIIIVETLSHFSWAAIIFKTNDWWWIPVYYTVIIVLVRNSKFERINHEY